MPAPPRVLISALHKSSGKTALSVGIAAALTARGRVVQAFKKGPDYIDAMWLEAATGRSCINLDFHTMSQGQIRAALLERGSGADLVLIEGNKGLHDGVAVDGADSNAALAVALAVPVVLVVDTTGITRGIAPMLHGFSHFDPRVRVAAVILNKVGGPRHESKLRAAVETYSDLPVIGAVPRLSDLGLEERHIGLVPAAECPRRIAVVERLAGLAGDHLDLERIEAVAAAAPAVPGAPESGDGRHRASGEPERPGAGLTVAVARCEAFCFYYPDDLEALRRAGARLVDFDPLRDPALPDADALFIGGGFPEVHMEALERNRGLREAVRAAVAGGMPVYAECGGLMYLARELRWGDRRCRMAGAIEADVRMHPRPQGRGYVVLEETAAHPWPSAPGVGPAPARPAAIAAHEFHHSSLEGLDPATRFAYTVRRGHGVDGQHDGILTGNVLASYAHRRDVHGSGWVRPFLGFVAACRGRRHGGGGRAEAWRPPGKKTEALRC